ncbi:MAG TPA: class I SAM-dependent methyltransferase [Streptosporangiaceae bacterium]|nr:class I SAM-dependent methyltransferase [Streptosporangiaceae bacterium]
MEHSQETTAESVPADAAQLGFDLETHARRAASFGAAATDYATHRPDYPLDAIGWAMAPALASIERAHKGRRKAPPPRPIDVLDLGAGTGKLTAQLAEFETSAGKPQVVAVEPDPQMLGELRRRLPSVRALAGKAEEIPLPDGSVDFVIAGQAIHWFNLDLAIPEIARILRPGGVLAGLWNADDARVAWVSGLHEASGRRTVVPIGGAERDDEDMNDWLGSAGKRLFWPPEDEEFTHSHVRTAESMIATLRTHSAFLIMGEEEREAALANVRQYLDSTPETSSGEFSLPLITLALRAVRR